MNLSETYIVANTNLIQIFKNIKEFTIDLGTKLMNDNGQFHPTDLIIQSHYVYHKEIIQSLGNIGSLLVYNSNQITNNSIAIYNEDRRFEYALDENLSLYDNINMAFDLFIKIYDKPKKVQPVPSKPFKDMNEAERIAYARAFR